jgi:DNA-binding transcriptional LysR family regulator
MINLKWRWIMLDTDQLRSFVAIIDTGSFTRAAERVHKTQSAVSMHIRRLEEQLGKRLFLKSGRGVRLSDDGEKLVAPAREMLRIEAAALNSLSGKALSGHVRFGIPDDYSDIIMPEVLTRFVRKNPLVEISVVCEPSVHLTERVLSRDLDLAVVTACADMSGVEMLSTSRLRFVVAATSQAHLARPLPLALASGICQWRQLTLKALDEAGIPSRMLLVSANYAAISPIVEAGLAVTVLPEDAIRRGQKALGPESGLPILPVSGIGLMQATNRPSAEATALATVIRDVLGRPRTGSLGADSGIAA